MPPTSRTGDEQSPMPVIGYSDKVCVQPGETISFMVSCEAPNYEAKLVHLLSNGLPPRAGGPKQDELDAPFNGVHEGKRESFPKGSYLVIPSRGKVVPGTDFTFQAWIYPTLIGKGTQAVLTKTDEARGMVTGLFIDEHGRLIIRLVDASGEVKSLGSQISLSAKRWYFVACSHDGATNQAAVIHSGVDNWPGEEGSHPYRTEGRVDGGFGGGEGPFVIGAALRPNQSSLAPGTSFNGKVDSPRLFSRALTAHELESLRLGMPPSAYAEDLVAAWDFSADIQTTRVTDSSAHGLDGHTVNNPKRAVTGHNWTGREVDFKRAPQEYGAIYFHEDDLEDAGWSVDFSFDVPEDLRSGIYAVHLQSGEHEDHVPFFVRPRRGAPQSKIAFLLPTLTYLAYSSFHSYTRSDLAELKALGTEYPARPFEKYSVVNGLLGLYDFHADGSGVSSVSRLRPILTQRPGFVGAHLSSGKGAPHLLSADLILAEWLETKGFEYDIITDEDLHREGVELLKPYKVVLTGSHPEYFTERMLGGTESYLKGGGRVMYLGGNGFYWVTSIDPLRPHLVELRRWGGTQAWRSEPGEYYHSTTGEMGGTWRNRGRGEHKLVGVGYTGEGIDVNRPYQRMPDSFDPKVAFIFEGIGKDELIGELDNPVLGHGAAGFEIDRLDFGMGTPAHAKLLARSTQFPDSYLHAIDELNHMETGQTGSVNPLVRADMVLVDYPNGGAVFSAGSISWCGCLANLEGRNNVSTLTENVLRRFSSEASW